MKNNLHASHDDFLVQIDGKTASEHLGFVEALKVGLKLRQQNPQSHVRVLETEPSNQRSDAIH